MEKSGTLPWPAASNAESYTSRNAGIARPRPETADELPTRSTTMEFAGKALVRGLGVGELVGEVVGEPEELGEAPNERVAVPELEGVLEEEAVLEGDGVDVPVEDTVELDDGVLLGVPDDDGVLLGVPDVDGCAMRESTGTKEMPMLRLELRTPAVPLTNIEKTRVEARVTVLKEYISWRAALEDM